MPAAAMLKITKLRYLCNCLTDFYSTGKIGLLTAPTVKKFEFHKSKMADGRHFENR